MMGKQTQEPRLWITGFDLSQRVRDDHELRAVKRHVDFRSVRDEVAHLYGRNGNVSVDPAVILKMMFLLFYYDIPSERELMRVIPERLDFLWFLDYGLDTPVPHHSVLSKARRRWGQAIFEDFFIQTVLVCVRHGLVDGSKVHVDASLVRADASNDSVIQMRPEVIEALRGLYATEESKLEDFWQHLEDAESAVAPWPPAALDGDGPQDGNRYEPVNRELLSTTDPDAPAVRQGRQESRLRYKNHRAIDDAFGVVTATETTPGDVADNHELLGLLEQHDQNTGLDVETVVGDSKYGTVENYRACKGRGLRTHMADLKVTQAGTGRRKGIFGEDAFVYDAATDTYRCPAGQTLKQRRHQKKRKAYEYSAGRKVCAACVLREQCTRSKSGRTVKRHKQQALVDAARTEAGSRAAKRDRRRRKHLAEGSFADAANNHGFKRSRWRRLWRQRIQDWLIAGIQNIRILLQHGRVCAAGEHPTVLGLPLGFVGGSFGFLRGACGPVWGPPG